MRNTLIRRTSERKNYILQFLPAKLEYLTKSETILYDDKNINTNYIIDLVHNLLLKYYFRRNNEFNLSSIILKENYGRYYNLYIDYLREKGILILKKNYSVGHSSRIYCLSEDIINDKIDRFKNNNRTLLRKKDKKKDLNANNKINLAIKLKLIDSLNSATIDTESAYFFINSILDEKNSKEKNFYAIDSIKEGNIFWHFDDYGRFHSNFTILKSFIRKHYLMIDGEKVHEYDIPNSQPLFLLNLISQSDIRCKSNELQLFAELVKVGKIYEYIAENSNKINRKEIKKSVYQVLFGINGRTTSDRVFKKCFPSIHNFIVEYKRMKKNYKSIAHTLQTMESDFVYNKILFKFSSQYPEANFITVHDSIIVPDRWNNQFKSLFYKELSNLYN